MNAIQTNNTSAIQASVISVMLATISHDGDASGYVVEQIVKGRNFSVQQFATKTFPNGRQVNRTVFYPGSNVECSMTEKHAVLIGSEEHKADEIYYYSSPFHLPAGAFNWTTKVEGGVRNCFANFRDAESAEAYASEQPAGGHQVIFKRKIH